LGKLPDAIVGELFVAGYCFSTLEGMFRSLEIEGRFNVLYTHNSVRLMNFAQRYVDVCTAEDIVQDAFVKYYDKMSQYTDDELCKLLYVTVRNMCIDKLRHDSCASDFKKRMEAELSLKELDVDTDYEQINNEQEKLAEIAKIVNAFPEKKKLIFSLYYYKGIDSKTIAEMLSLSQRTVENTVYRALNSIREHLLK
jgi:RNA polymerase sigma-70 factor (family 1)